MFTNPELLILNQSTIVLDAETQNELILTLEKLCGSVTLIVIAYRLSTILSEDKIIYLESGKMIAYGTLPEVRDRITAFEKQAKLLGI